jgi:hypothetical protein
MFLVEEAGLVRLEMLVVEPNLEKAETALPLLFPVRL